MPAPPVRASLALSAVPRKAAPEGAELGRRLVARAAVAPAPPSEAPEVEAEVGAGVAGRVELSRAALDPHAWPARAAVMPTRAELPSSPPPSAALSRSVTSAVPAGGPAPTAPAPVAPVAAGPAIAQRLGAAELEELYEGLIGRLRRELLLERERVGNLFGL